MVKFDKKKDKELHYQNKTTNGESNRKLAGVDHFKNYLRLL
jgi:hypothetical protein